MVSAGNWSHSIGVLLKPINPNGISPKTHIKPFFNGFNGCKLMVCNGISDSFVMVLEFSVMVLLCFFSRVASLFLYNAF